MITAWTQHLKTDEEKQRFEHSVRSCTHVLDRLIEIIENDLKGTAQAERSVKAYDNANWAYRQAHVNGYISAMTKISALCKIEETDDRSDKPRIRVKANRPRKEVPISGTPGSVERAL